MSEELEKRLRSALKPIDPGDAFTQAVIARLEREGAGLSPKRRPHPPIWRWASGAVAATMLLGLLLHAHQERTREGIEARQELMQALRLTAGALQWANQTVNEADGAPGNTNR